MSNLVKNTGISISGSIQALAEGESLSFPNSILETTIRVTCVRLKNTKGRVYSVNRHKDGTHTVTRIS